MLFLVSIGSNLLYNSQNFSWVGGVLFICMWSTSMGPNQNLIKFLLTQLPVHIVFLLPFIFPPFCSTISPAILPVFTVAPFYYSSFLSILQHCFQHISFYLLTFSWLSLINMLAGEKKKHWQEQVTHIFMWVCLLRAMGDIRKGKSPSSPTPIFSLMALLRG